MAPLDSSLKGRNVIALADVETPRKEVSNPIDVESGETLFIPNPQGYDHDDVRINPKHPRARVYQLLMDCYKQDPSGKSFKKAIDPYLDAPSDSEQNSSDEEMGRSPQLFTPYPDKDSVMEHWNGNKNDPDFYAYDN